MRLIDKESLMEVINCNKSLADGYHMKDYVFNQIITDIESEPIVEAIPIEWLLTTGMMMVDNDTRTKLFNLISLWRKENG